MADTVKPDSVHVALAERLEAAHLSHADPRASRILAELVEDAIGLVSEGTDVVDIKLLASSFAEMRRALAVFRPWDRGPRKITAFGSARIQPDDPVYAMAREFGKRIAEAGYMVITGGGPGIMSAVVDGAGVENSFGVGIRLPFEQKPHPGLRDDPKLMEFKYFFTRKVFFLKEASAVVLFPGGLGTHDEGFETLTLVQTGKSRMMPIVCVDVPGSSYWPEWDAFMRGQLVERGLIGHDDLSLYRITHDIDEAVAEITGFYRIYHSMRSIRGTTVVRLRHGVADSVLDALATEFADILGGKPLRRIDPMREEYDEPHTLGLPRIALAFDLLHFGRLRQLVNRLNELGASAPAA